MSQPEEMPVSEIAAYALEYIDLELESCVREAERTEAITARIKESDPFRKTVADIAKANRERETELRNKKKLIMAAAEASRRDQA